MGCRRCDVLRIAVKGQRFRSMRSRVVEESHSAEVHAEIRADIMRWRALRFVGFQQRGKSHDPSDVIELRNCTCGSTLGRRTRRTP